MGKARSVGRGRGVGGWARAVGKTHRDLLRVLDASYDGLGAEDLGKVIVGRGAVDNLPAAALEEHVVDGRIGDAEAAVHGLSVGHKEVRPAAPLA